MTHRRDVMFAGVALVVALAACGGTSQSASHSLSASRSHNPSASSASISPSAASSEVASVTSAPITSSTNQFSLLPSFQPADFEGQIACNGTIGASDPVAIVQLEAAVEGTGAVVLRDYADNGKPMTVCTFEFASVTQLIDARHVVIQGNGALAVVDLPEVRYHWFNVPPPGYFLAVGPKLDQVVWISEPNGPGSDTIHLSTNAGDQVIATLPTPGRGRCGSPETDSKEAEYTRSGSHLLVLNQPIPDMNSLVVVAGETTVLSVIPPSTGWPPDAYPLMPVWSPISATLYYRQGGDIWKWDEASRSKPQLFLPGVPWVNPTISADGNYLAYAVRRADNVLHDVYLVDLSHSGSPQHIGDGARKLPVFLNATQLWFKSEGDDHGCAGTELEKPLIYDVVDKLEFNSVIYQPIRVWPSTSSNF